MSRIYFIVCLSFLCSLGFAQHDNYGYETIDLGLDGRNQTATLTFELKTPVVGFSMQQTKQEYGQRHNETYAIQATFHLFTNTLEELTVSESKGRGRHNQRFLAVSKNRPYGSRYVELTGTIYDAGYNNHQQDKYFITLKRNDQQVNFNITNADAVYKHIIELGTLKTALENYVSAKQNQNHGNYGNGRGNGYRNNFQRLQRIKRLKERAESFAKNVLQTDLFNYIERENNNWNPEPDYTPSNPNNGQNSVWSNLGYQVQTKNFQVDRHTQFQSVSGDYILLQRSEKNVLSQYKLTLGYAPKLEIAVWTYDSNDMLIVVEQKSLTIYSSTYSQGRADLYNYNQYQRGVTSSAAFQYLEVENAIKLLVKAANNYGETYKNDLQELSCKPLQSYIDKNQYGGYNY